MNKVRINLYDDRVQKIVFFLLSFCIYLYSVRYGYGIIESPHFFGIIAVFLGYFLLNPQLRYQPIDFKFLLLYIVFFFIGIYKHIFLEGQTETFDFLPYAWVVPSTYMLGKVCVGNKKNCLNNRNYTILLLMALGMYIQGVLNYLGYFIYGLYKQNNEQILIFVKWRSFWNAATDGTRNNWNNGFLMIVGALFFSILIRKKKRYFPILVIMLSFIAVLVNTCFGGRTVLAMMLLMFSIMALIYLVANYSHFSKRHKIVVWGIIGTIILAVCIVYYMYLNNIAGVGDLYNNSYYLNRNGGVINNVRIQMWAIGLKRAFLMQKGGWNIADITDLDTTHSAWIDFARYYDIIVFLLLVLFMLVMIFNSLRVIIKYGNDYPVLYFAISSEFAMFIYGMYEPVYIMHQDLLLPFFFICGLVSGIGCVAETWDYRYFNEEFLRNENRYLAFGYGVLSFGILTSLYMDWWSDRLELIWAAIIPTVAYILGGRIYNKRYRVLALSIISIINVIMAICMYVISAKTEYFKFDMYTEPFTYKVVDKSVFIAFMIMPLAMIIGTVFYRIRIDKVKSVVITILFTGIILYPVITDGRLGLIKEALKLQFGMKYGLQWIASKENYLGINTSHSMWLDYARDYGIVVLGLLGVFEIWSIYCFVKMIRKRNKDIVDYILIVAFVLFNYHFMFEASAITSKYIWALGLFIYGMIISSLVIYEKENNSYNKKEKDCVRKYIDTIMEKSR